MFSPVAVMKDHGHIDVMDQRKYQQDATCHAADAYQDILPAVHRFPVIDHQRGIPKIQQVIPRQQQPVDRMGDDLIPL